MISTLSPGQRSGKVRIPASKSQAHRLLICSALGVGDSMLVCGGISKDIAASIDCLRAMGAQISVQGDFISVKPIAKLPTGTVVLPCCESGSTLRFLLPLVGALGLEGVFHMEGRLPERPLAPLDSQLQAHGMSLDKQGDKLFCKGKLRGGDYSLPGDVSSQYISGLLMALPQLAEESRLQVTGRIESSAYITMTEDALRLSGIEFEKENNCYTIPGSQNCHMPRQVHVEGDYSNGAFFLCMGALSDKGVEVYGLGRDSNQGDRAVVDILRRFGADIQEREESIFVRRSRLNGCVIDASPIPDLIPVLSVVASAAQGETQVINAQRLRIKESDRLNSTANMIKALGGDITELDSGLIIHGKPALHGGRVDSCGDHRIAMSAAVAASLCVDNVIVDGSEAVNKSYPRFWQDFESLEGAEV